MKKLTLGLAAVGLTASLGAYAALPTGAAPFRINVPNLKSGFTFNLTGLYWRPTNAALDYAIKVYPKGSKIYNQDVHSIDPQFKWGFQVGLGYVFPNSGNDVQVAWTHLNSGSSDAVHITNAGPDNWVGPVYVPFTFMTFGFDSADSHVNFKYDAADLNVGQYVNVGTRLQLRLHTGVRWAQIRKFQNAHYYNSTDTTKDYLNGSAWSKMEGFGPRFGVNASYHFTNCFGLVGGLATSLLVSRVEGNLVGVVVTPGNQGTPATNDTYNYPLPKIDRIVPAVDGKIGVDYSHVFSGSVFSIEGGYKIDHYFDALTSVRLGTTTFATARDNHSVSFDGPYVRLNLKV